MNRTDEQLLASMRRLQDEARLHWQKLDDAAEELCRIAGIDRSNAEQVKNMHAVIFSGRAPDYALAQMRNR